MELVALKVQRRRFSYEAAREIAVYQRLHQRIGPCPEIIALREAFEDDGHVCLAFEQHGNSLCEALERGPLPPARVRRAAHQIAAALEQLHHAGYTHTDVKPDNILYRPRSGDARLADLGDAQTRLRHGTLYGTREYTAPEMILGAPLAPSIDVWSFGCTVFEMLTDRLLFDPRAMAAKKYREFNQAARAEEQMPLAASVLEDQAAEKAEQLTAGKIIAGKYGLVRALGQGRFSTVWAARSEGNGSIDASDALVRKHRRLPARERERAARQRQDRKWRHEKGANDLLDLALNYEQLLLIAQVAGAFPQSMMAAARYRGSYFENDGAFRFRPALRAVSLRTRLRRGCSLRGETLGEATDFLQRCLTIDPRRRLTAAEALRHSWLRGA